MFDYEAAIVTKDNEIIKAGDKVRITYYDDNTKEGTFVAIHPLYENLEINVIDKSMECGCYNLNIPFHSILRVEKIDKAEKININRLLDNYQLLGLMNNRLKFEMSKTKKNNDLNNYSKCKALQENVQKLLDDFEKQEIEIPNKISNILQEEREMYLAFRRLDIRKNKREGELTEGDYS